MAKSANDNMMTIDFRCSLHPSPRLRTVMGWMTKVPSGVQRQSPVWRSGLGTKFPEAQAFLLILNLSFKLVFYCFCS